MPKLWLTYAWKDNEDSDVDFIAGRISGYGIDVLVDRTQLLAGRRLWDQISDQIAAPDLDAWAVYATANSLRSEPCQEELAYALDRALRTRGSAFPLIGIFPAPLDRSVIPSALATRLWVHLKDPDWSGRVAGAVTGSNSLPMAPVPAHDFRVHDLGEETVVEMRPREGYWYPATVMLKEEEFGLLKFAYKGPRGNPRHRPAAFQFSEASSEAPDGSRWKGWHVQEQIDSTVSLYALLKGRPSAVAFGSGRLVVLNISS